ncbi:SigB/SigF/SigG family RNA polymerase sigma factor [Streptacidiphilus sp. MAP12-16]|uniref:SigB/SigF/SigG family RNA polymerase sigma factor n=1 Tax=Streptacidiphilus sp. MAP12-16 TaxID=3156300 RepID=UPI00351228F7
MRGSRPEGQLVSAGGSPPDARALSKVLFTRLRALDEGSPEYTYVRNTLVELNLALVRFVAARFRSRSEPMEDIVQSGTVGLIKAINRFDPDRQVEFPTFALPTISGEIKRFFRDTSWAAHVPRRLQELRLTLAKAIDELTQTLDHVPTTPDLARHLGLSTSEVIEGLRASNAYTAGTLDTAEGESHAHGRMNERLGHEDRALEHVDNHESLKPLMAGLPERERAVLSLRFGRDLTQSQIGAELGISQMHVSRLLSRAIGQLREGLLTDDRAGLRR